MAFEKFSTQNEMRCHDKMAAIVLYANRTCQFGDDKY